MNRTRVSEGYEPRWDLDRRHGERMQDTVNAFLDGLVAGAVEVKSDRLTLETGNVWIEFQCRRRDGWQDSGIRTSEADYWCIVFAETAVLGVPTVVLRAVAEHLVAWRDARGRPRFLSEEKDGSHPTRGVRVELGYFLTLLRAELRRQSAAA